MSLGLILIRVRAHVAAAPWGAVADLFQDILEDDLVHLHLVLKWWRINISVYISNYIFYLWLYLWLGMCSEYQKMVNVYLYLFNNLYTE